MGHSSKQQVLRVASLAQDDKRYFQLPEDDKRLFPLASLAEDDESFY
jgi:hypothetical protein